MQRGGFDLDPESRRSLELDAVLEWIASYARTAPGAQRIRELRPHVTAAAATATLESVAEVQHCLRSTGRLVPAGIPDPTPALGGLGLAGRALDAPTLRGLALVCEAVGSLRQRLIETGMQAAPYLHGVGQALPDLNEPARMVLLAIEPDGRLADRASDELRRVRLAHIRTGERLHEVLRKQLHDPDARDSVRDDFITQRNGRYVIPIRTDAPRPVRGIVHGTSSSGATQFVEPLGTVELNNELVRLGEREQAETERLLSEWSEAFRRRRGDLSAAVESLAQIDALQARALFAQASGATLPVVADDEVLHLVQVRHPLLDRRLRDEGAAAVPLDLRLEPGHRAVVLSGPNTGGKTVALKTVGLAVILAQSGVPVPGREVRLPAFRQLRADIGDHQSIEADLSTYSAHVRTVVESLRDLSPPALFLFDEIGTGTEPAEGAALAQSILEALLRPGMLTVATTHHGALKTWAFSTPAVASAALEFDEQRLQPTYRILMGAAGVSAGLDIAERLGLDRSLVERARAMLGEPSQRSETYMSRLRELTAELEGRRRELVEGQVLLEQRRESLEARSAERERRLRERAESGLERVLGEFRQLARRELREIRERRERHRAEREIASLDRRLRLEQERRKEEWAPDGPGAAAEPLSDPRPGMRVRVHSLAREGTVREVRGRTVEVQLGNVTVQVAASDLRSTQGAASKPEARRAPTRAPRSAEPAESPDELKLIGMRVEEALDRLDRFLDGAAMADLGEVRIVHGHGTGRLRAAVREFLRQHVHVRSFRQGRSGEGGDGATVATLKG